MKRDMDLIRTILLRVEEHGSADTPIAPFHVEGYDDAQVHYHVKMLDEAGLFTARRRKMGSGDDQWFPVSLTWEGHEFLDAVRDPEVWSKTKAGAQKVGSWTIGLLKDLGTAYLKNVAKERLGLDL